MFFLKTIWVLLFCQLQCTFYVCKKANVAKLKVEVNVSSVLTVLLQASFNTILSSVVTRELSWFCYFPVLVVGILFSFLSVYILWMKFFLYSVNYSCTMKIFILKAVVLNWRKGLCLFSIWNICSHTILYQWR